MATVTAHSCRRLRITPLMYYKHVCVCTLGDCLGSYAQSLGHCCTHSPLCVRARGVSHDMRHELHELHNSEKGIDQLGNLNE